MLMAIWQWRTYDLSREARYARLHGVGPFVLAVQFAQGTTCDLIVKIAKAPICNAVDHPHVNLHACKQLYMPANSILQLSIAEAKCIAAKHIQSQYPQPYSNHWHHGSSCELHSTKWCYLLITHQ